MKQIYFTPSNIAGSARQMLDSLADITRRHPAPASLESSALLVLDMQSYFLDEASHAFVPSAPAILPGVNALIEAYSLHGLPIYMSQHINTSVNAGRMAAWWREIIVEENPLSALTPELRTRQAVVFEKTRYDAFIGSPLDELLRARGISQLVICGVMTHLCCETTARSAFMRGYEVLFTVDGTATYNQEFHNASIMNLAHGFATPVLISDVLSILDHHHG